MCKWCKYCKLCKLCKLCKYSKLYKLHNLCDYHNYIMLRSRGPCSSTTIAKMQRRTSGWVANSLGTKQIGNLFKSLVSPSPAPRSPRKFLAPQIGDQLITRTGSLRSPLPSSPCTEIGKELAPHKSIGYIKVNESENIFTPQPHLDTAAMAFYQWQEMRPSFQAPSKTWKVSH